MRTDDVHDLEEGDACPGCEEGILEGAPGPDCSCHLSPPCGSCVEDGLKCGSCDWRMSDGFPEPSPGAP